VPIIELGKEWFYFLSFEIPLPTQECNCEVSINPPLQSGIIAKDQNN